MTSKAKNILPVILAGGSGSRVWPFSKNDLPKQFVELKCGETLFEKALHNVVYQLKNNPKLINHVLVVTNEKYRFLCQNSLKKFSISFTVILEPEKKNTAASVCLAAKYCEHNYKDSIMFIMSSDHFISNKKKFSDSVKYISNYILNNVSSFGMLGVNPRFASTEYGYLETKAASDAKLFNVVNFKEKPKKNLAEEYLKSGNFLWNSGIFIFSPHLLINFIKKDTAFGKHLQASWRYRTNDIFFIRPNPKYFYNIKPISFDYFFVEKIIKLNIKIVTTVLSSAWSDLGSWESLENHLSRPTESHSILSNNNSIFTNKVSVAIGVSDLLVFQDEDVLFIANKDKLKNNPLLVNKLLSEYPKLSENLNIVHRPWGYYEILDSHKNFLTKKITVFPKSKLSLQIHNFRSEHWIVLHGVATVQIGKSFYKLKKNQSIDIPVKKQHRLINDTNKNLELIEVQSGSYIGEDDIKRINDEYKR